MTKRSLLSVALLFVSASFSPASPLAGSWNKDGAPYAELRADHTGRVGPNAVKWSAQGSTLRLAYASGKTDTMSYLLRGDVLTIFIDGETEVYTRAAAKTKAAKASVEKAPAEKAGKDKLSALLLSSAWCSFSYNKISGASHQERVVFRGDGTWGSGARGESYSSGAGGTYAGQSDSSSGGRWKVSGAALLMSRGGGALEDTGLSASRNSNGYPILKSGNKEYSSCN